MIEWAVVARFLYQETLIWLKGVLGGTYGSTQTNVREVSYEAFSSNNYMLFHLVIVNEIIFL
jgi:hypothetical protein